MEAVLNLFLEFLSEEQRSSSNTIAAYTNDLNQFLSFIRERSEPVARWDEVTQGLLQAFVSRLQAKDYASSTVARKVAALKSFFHFLSTEQRLAVDPTHELSSPKVVKQLPKSLSASQVAHLMAAAPEDNSPKSLRDRALLALLYATGMRVTEVVRLSTHDIDLEREQIGCDSRIDRPRILPVNAEAVEALAAYLELGRPPVDQGPGRNRSVPEPSRKSAYPARALADHQGMRQEGGVTGRRDPTHPAPLFCSAPDQPGNRPPRGAAFIGTRQHINHPYLHTDGRGEC